MIWAITSKSCGRSTVIMLLTSGGRGAFEEHRVWREALRGIRGLILWDEKNEFVDADGNVAAHGREAAPYFAELRGGLGALLINRRRHTDPIGVLYSPVSMRVQWLLDRRASRADWSRRNASTEYQDDTIRAATRNFARLIEHRGSQHRFVSTEEWRRGELGNRDYRILMLPHTIALSPIEAREIRAFVEHGGIVVADGEPGIFDDHGRRMAKPALSEVFAGAAACAATSFAFEKGKAIYATFPDERGRESGRVLSEILKAAGVQRCFPLMRADGGPASDIETYVFENGEVTIVALLRDFVPSTDPSSREAIVVTLPHPLNARDLRTGRRLGSTDRLAVDWVRSSRFCWPYRKSRSLHRPSSGHPVRVSVATQSSYSIGHAHRSRCGPCRCHRPGGKHCRALLRKFACHSERGVEAAAIRLRRPSRCLDNPSEGCARWRD